MEEIRKSKYGGSIIREGGKQVYTPQNRNEVLMAELVEVSLGLLTYEQLAAEAVIDLYNSLSDKSTVNDIRMGSTSPQRNCVTCQANDKDCVGHFGMLSFPPGMSFVHPYYLKTGIVKALLNIFCFECSYEPQQSKTTLLFNSMEIEKEEENLYQVEGEKRLKNLAERASGKSCHVCHKQHSHFEINKNGDVVRKIKGEEDKKFAEKEVRMDELLNHFRTITKYLDTHNLHSFIGFDRVDYSGLIVRAIPIIPPRHRPQNSVGGKISESDITLIYMNMMDIIYEYENLRRTKNIDEKDAIFKAYVKNLRDFYSFYITGDSDVNLSGRIGSNNSVPMIMKNIIDKKTGLRMGNMVSARVNNSARSVITCNNNIKPTEAQIPRMMAEIFSLHAEVTAENISLLTALTRQQVVKMIISADGSEKKVNMDNYKRVELNIGDIVRRRLLTGDIVIVNRQPSLHRWNSIALRAVVIENPDEDEEDIHAIGLNTGYVTGMNADFDGDEAHVHVVDSMNARAEAAFLMAPNMAPVNDKDSVNIFTIIQNSVWGAYTMTSQPRRIPRENWYQMTKGIQDFTGPRGSFEYDYMKRIKHIEDNAARIFKEEGVNNLGIYNTYTLISMALPTDFSYMNMIVEGIFVRGVLKKSISGGGEESIIRHMFESHGANAIAVYIHVMQQVTAAFMNEVSHTFSLSDVCPSDNLQRNVTNLIDRRLKETKKISQQSIKGIFDHRLYADLLSDTIDTNIGEFSLILDPDLKKDFIENSGHHLFDVLQAQRNRFYKGLSDNYYSRELVDKSLRKSINDYIKLPDLDDEKFVPGNLIAVLKRKRDPFEEAKAKRYPELREHIFNMLKDRVFAFVEISISNPMESEAIVCLSRAEIDTIEADTMDKLDLIGEEATSFLDQEEEKKSMENMVESGARGKKDNLKNAKLLMGQQTMSDGRLKPKISGGTRVNAFFLENSPDPKARGFVAESLYQGLSPQGWLSSAMPSRQTQMDTNFKTRDTGYAAKKMMAAAGDYVVRADGTVRDEQDRIITFSPSNFIDPSRMIKRGDTFSVVNCQQLYNDVKGQHDAKVKSVREYNRKW